MKSSPDLPKLDYLPEEPLMQSIEKEVRGIDTPNIIIGWRFPGKNSKEYEMLQLVNYILYNQKAGLIDIDLMQQQKLLYGRTQIYGQADYSLFIMMGFPKATQSLEDTKNLLLNEIEKLKTGNFDERLLQATINNFKFYEIQQLENNSNRAHKFVNAFISGKDGEKSNFS